VYVTWQRTQYLHCVASATVQCRSSKRCSTSLRCNYLGIRKHLRVSTSINSGLIPSVFPTNNLYAFLFSPIRATWPAHLILLDLIILIKLGEEFHYISYTLKVGTVANSRNVLVLTNLTRNKIKNGFTKCDITSSKDYDLMNRALCLSVLTYLIVLVTRISSVVLNDGTVRYST
jgi:hypothetical protein